MLLVSVGWLIENASVMVVVVVGGSVVVVVVVVGGGFVGRPRMSLIPHSTFIGLSTGPEIGTVEKLNSVERLIISQK